MNFINNLKKKYLSFKKPYLKKIISLIKKNSLRKGISLREIYKKLDNNSKNYIILRKILGEDYLKKIISFLGKNKKIIYFKISKKFFEEIKKNKEIINNNLFLRIDKIKKIEELEKIQLII